MIQTRAAIAWEAKKPLTIETVQLQAVSYTHLDVYKRQALRYKKAQH